MEPSAEAAPKATISGKRRAWQVAKRLLRSIILIYVLVGIAMFAFQTKLIFPGAAWQGKPESHIEPAADEELVRLKTAPGTEVVGLFVKTTLIPPATPQPCILFFYGN